MPYGTPTQILLVATPAVRRAALWTQLPDVRVHACGHGDFSVVRHLSPDRPILLYQMDRRYADTLRLLDEVTAAQNDVCLILLGREIAAERVATLLRRGAFDYLTWPCSGARLSSAIADGLANRRTFLEVRNLSDELARTNQALAHDRDVLTQCNRNLSGLNHLTQALAASLDPEAVVKTLFADLPQFVQADALGLAKNHPPQAWAWSASADRQREERLRAHVLDRLAAPREGGRIQRSPSAGSSPVKLTLVPQARLRHESESAGPVIATEVPVGLGVQSTGLLRVERRRDHPFTEQERQLLATVGTSLALSLRNAESHRHLQDLALRDPLTGVLNRRALDGPLTRELKTGLRYGTAACLILLDLDYFKTVNDVLGHVAGDEVLRAIAALVRDTVRDVDSVGRYGGEEFAVVLPHTHLAQAETLAERIRAGIERHAFELEDSQVRLTASLGVAALQAAEVATVADWVSAADQALYQAKAGGRNRVVAHGPDSSAPARAAALCLAA